MGQKINPIGIRLGITRSWDSKWFAKKSDYAKFLHEDQKIRNFIDKKEFRREGISKIEIERKSNSKTRVTITLPNPVSSSAAAGNAWTRSKKILKS